VALMAEHGVSTWLRDLGLENYAEAFRANGTDAELLSRLTVEDLIALGVTTPGHRRKLLGAITLLIDGMGPVPAATLRPVVAERRQLTMLFCDLIGSTELAARLDPEGLCSVMRAYQAACAEIVRGSGGHVAKVSGRRRLGLFWLAGAHEDDAERAVRAGLALIDAIARLESHADVQVRARAGIATGIVAVGDLIGEGASREETVVGEVPNLSARLQALAEPGHVVISQATRRLVGGLFELVDLGAQQLKGFAEPIMAWQVTGESRTEGRFEARQTVGLTPLVGREEEIALLLRRRRRVRVKEVAQIGAAIGRESPYRAARRGSRPAGGRAASRPSASWLVRARLSPILLGTPALHGGRRRGRCGPLITLQSTIAW
jgi:class 3 adenylate cyclase